jgi:hypothetical protein
MEGTGCALQATLPGLRGAVRRWSTSALLLVGPLLAESTWELSNGDVLVRVNGRGAILSDLRCAGDSASWLSSPLSGDPDELFGHFLCFDRWGPVSPAEAAAGFRFHGEAARVPWTPRSGHGDQSLELATTLPLAKFSLRREVSLANHGAQFRVSTEVENPTAQIRPFNLVEHITLAKSWNAPSVRMITNAREGGLHERGKPLVGAAVSWPRATAGNRTWDLRQPAALRGRFIASLTFPPEARWGWVGLQNPESGALLVYVWRVEEMPWLNVYWFANGERISQRAIEPGTTGLHLPLSELVDDPDVKERPVVHWLDPTERRNFTIQGGLAMMDADFGELTDLVQGPAGWVARDDHGNEQLVLSAE